MEWIVGLAAVIVFGGIFYAIYDFSEKISLDN